MDVELAEQYASAPFRRDYHPPLSEWSPEVELLAAIHDRLRDVVQVQYDKKLDWPETPRPQTAAEVLERRKREAKRARVRELFYPKKGGA